MVKAMAENGFGNCSNHYECQAACPKGIDVKFIARLNREFLKALAQDKVGALTKSAAGAAG
jgi:succinate dehydrogenase / fumarate reductase iron-sulfur subunit